MKSNLNFLLAAVASLACGSGVQAGMISDFESGTAEGWTSIDPSVSLSVVPGGSLGSNYALRVDRTSGGWNNTMLLALSAAGWSDLAANTAFSLDIKAQGGSDIPGWWLQIVPVLNSSANAWVQYPNSMGGNLDGQWHTYLWEYPAQPADPGGNTHEVLLCGQGGASPNMNYFIDNIQVVPEPAALGLLAMSGLVVRRRRI